MKNKAFLFICAFLSFWLFSAWVLVPPTQRYAGQQEAYKQIIWQDLSQKYQIDMNESAVSAPTYAVKDSSGFTTWKAPAGDICIYVYGDCFSNEQECSYYGVYSLALQKVMASEIKEK